MLTSQAHKLLAMYTTLAVTHTHAHTHTHTLHAHHIHVSTYAHTYTYTLLRIHTVPIHIVTHTRIAHTLKDPIRASFKSFLVLSTLISTTLSIMRSGCSLKLNIMVWWRVVIKEMAILHTDISLEP